MNRDRDEKGRFTSKVDRDQILRDIFDSTEPRSTREVARLLDVSRRRAHQLLEELYEDGEIERKKFEELGGVVWFRQ